MQLSNKFKQVDRKKQKKGCRESKSGEGGVRDSLDVEWSSFRDTSGVNDNIAAITYTADSNILAPPPPCAAPPLPPPLPAPLLAQPLAGAVEGDLKSDDVRSKTMRYRTKLCKDYMSGGMCGHGVRCIFAHSLSQLRTKEDNIALGVCTESALCEEILYNKNEMRQMMHNRYTTPSEPVGVAVYPATGAAVLWDMCTVPTAAPVGVCGEATQHEPSCCYFADVEPAPPPQPVESYAAARGGLRGGMMISGGPDTPRSREVRSDGDVHLRSWGVGNNRSGGGVGMSGAGTGVGAAGRRWCYQHDPYNTHSCPIKYIEVPSKLWRPMLTPFTISVTP